MKKQNVILGAASALFALTAGTAGVLGVQYVQEQNKDDNTVVNTDGNNGIVDGGVTDSSDNKIRNIYFSQGSNTYVFDENKKTSIYERNSLISNDKTKVIYFEKIFDNKVFIDNIDSNTSIEYALNSNIVNNIFGWSPNDGYIVVGSQGISSDIYESSIINVSNAQTERLEFKIYGSEILWLDDTNFIFIEFNINTAVTEVKIYNILNLQTKVIYTFDTRISPIYIIRA